MKKKLALILTLVSAQVSAQDLMLGDLNFIQKKSTILWNTELDLAKTKTKFFADQSDQSTYDRNERRETSWNNSVTYGLSDKLNAGVSFNYDFLNKVTNNRSMVSGADAAHKSLYREQGASDLTLKGTYRLLSQNIYLDLNLAATLGVGTREIGSTAVNAFSNGNHKQGHSSVDMGVAIGQKRGPFEWRTAFILSEHLNGQSKTNLANGGSYTSDTQSFTNVNLNGQIQYRLEAPFAFALGANIANVGSQKKTSSINGASVNSTTDAYYIYTGSFIAKFNMSNESVFRFGYALSNTYDVVTKSQNIKSVQETFNSTFTLGFDYLF
jgi:hypothetical protein